MHNSDSRPRPRAGTRLGRVANPELVSPNQIGLAGIAGSVGWRENRPLLGGGGGEGVMHQSL